MKRFHSTVSILVLLFGFLLNFLNPVANAEESGNHNMMLASSNIVEELRDAHKRLLGRIHRRSNGQLEARDASQRRVGVYDPKSDVTRDASGRLYGYGNLLSALIVGCRN